jgi:hypothetical protein
MVPHCCRISQPAVGWPFFSQRRLVVLGLPRREVARGAEDKRYEFTWHYFDGDQWSFNHSTIKKVGI